MGYFFFNYQSRKDLNLVKYYWTGVRGEREGKGNKVEKKQSTKSVIDVSMEIAG